MSLIAMADFLKKSGMRKVGSGLYMFSVLSYLLQLKALSGEEYKAIAIVIVLALMGGNAFEHVQKSKETKPNAAPNPNPAVS